MNPSDNRANRIIAFDHIPKTGGHTVRHVLQQNFGRHHVDVRHKVDESMLDHLPEHPLGPSFDQLMVDPPQVYGPEELRTDDRLHGGVRSFSSHAVVPFVDFGEYESRIDWFTLVREPVKRFISHYQMNQGDADDPMGLREWAEALPSGNQQTIWLVGREDVEAAKEILVEKFAAVGLVEQFDRSLLMLKEFAGGPHFVPTYQRAKNTAKKTHLKEHVRDNWEEYEEVVHAYNELDIELYRFVREELWPAQVEQYGEGRLQRDEQLYFGPQAFVPATHRARRVANAAYRRLVYQPFVTATHRS